jgi:heat-inducible transcriptional repressor
MMKPSLKKQEKENHVLLGLVELYIKTGKPIGSNTLKENGFDHLSSATIRNYFFKLEEQGFLSQQHSSGGRSPTDAAYKLYIESALDSEGLSKHQRKHLDKELFYDGKEIITYLHQALELLSEESGCAALMCSPRFDQDLISDIRLLLLDAHRILCILMTGFGLVKTEIFYIPTKISSFSLKRIEAYLAFKRSGFDKPTLDQEELTLAEHVHNELLLRHIVGHATFTQEDIYKTGFTKLLRYPEFQDTGALANTLSLFENPYLMQKLCDETWKHQQIKTWIGKDLEPYHTGCQDCSMIMIPYTIRDKHVGALGILGPTRIPYKYLFELLTVFSELISSSLSSILLKHQMSYRKPHAKGVDFKTHPQSSASASPLLLDVEPTTQGN